MPRRKYYCIKVVCLTCFLLFAMLTAASCSNTGKSPSSNVGSLSDFCDSRTKDFLLGETLPELLRYYRDHETAERYEEHDKAQIQAVMKALAAIEVTGETDTRFSDYEDTFVFVTSEGAEYTFSFNGRRFITGDFVYELENDKALWELAESISADE